MLKNNTESFVFNNGYASFKHLANQDVSKYIDKISTFESMSKFSIRCFWNREWEYSFILDINEKNIISGKILDVGAGKSLLPFLLSNNENKIMALDIDNGSFYPYNSLNIWYADKNEIFGTNVEFINMDLTKTDFANEYFDFIYSVSVFEHLDDPLTGLKELWRLLKVGGVLAITIDVSLDNSRGMFSRDLKNILDFLFTNGISLLPCDFNVNEDTITTDWFKKYNPSLLPWKRKQRSSRERLKNLLFGKITSLEKYYTYFASLSIIGLAFQKPYNQSIDKLNNNIS